MPDTKATTDSSNDEIDGDAPDDVAGDEIADQDAEWLVDGDDGDEVWVDAGYDDEDDDYVYVPEDRGIVKKVMVVVVCLLLFLFMVVGLGGYWLYSQVHPSGDSQPVVLVIPKDANLATISRLLEEKQIVGNATLFRYYAKWKDIPTIRAGEYDKLVTNDSMDHVIDRLKQGPIPPKTNKFGPVPEGVWIQDTFALMKKAFPKMGDDAAYAKAVAPGVIASKYRPDGAPLDGFLFPAAYQVSDDDVDNPQKLLDQMVKRFDQVGDEVGLGNAATTLNGVAGKTQIGPYQALIVASLVESEAKAPEDRARIARVIYNRLRSIPNEPLGIDATVLFAIGEHKAEITKSDLATDSPYNLRLKPGLTPSPINSPGKDSLIAALNPSTEPGADKWLYYVIADKEGHHFFTGNFKEFEAAQQRAREAGLL